MRVPFAIIVAVDQEFGIGKNGTLPWNLPGEIKHFKEITTASYTSHENVVIMGRKTWDSIPSGFRPLPRRLNIVLSRRIDQCFPQGVLKTQSLDEALLLLGSRQNGKVFVIGGAELFESAIGHPDCREIYLTQIHASFSCDRFFPAIPSSFKETTRSAPFTEINSSYSFVHYQKGA